MGGDISPTSKVVLQLSCPFGCQACSLLAGRVAIRESGWRLSWPPPYGSQGSRRYQNFSGTASLVATGAARSGIGAERANTGVAGCPRAPFIQRFASSAGTEQKNGFEASPRSHSVWEAMVFCIRMLSNLFTVSKLISRVNHCGQTTAIKASKSGHQ